MELLSAMSGLFLVLLFLITWKFWKFTKQYEDFPTYPLFRHCLYSFIFQETENIPFTQYMFQKLLSVLREHQNDGICLLWFGTPVLFLFHQDATKVFGSEKAALDKSFHYNMLKDSGFGTGLVTSNGETWRKHRKLYEPSFCLSELKKKLSIMNGHAAALVKRLDEASCGGPVNIIEVLKSCTFSIVFESFIGLYKNAVVREERKKEMLKVVDELADMTAFRMVYPWFFCRLTLYFVPYGRKFLKMLKQSQNILEKISRDLKSDVLSNTSTEGDDTELSSTSFTRILVEQHVSDALFTAKDMESEIATFLSAGYDTASSALLWCLYLLGLHPEVQEQVYNEVRIISEDNVTYGDLHNMEFLECVIKETLRLYPPIPIYARNTRKEIQCGKYIVPEGTTVVFFPYTLHRDPKIFPDPEKFKPNRFLEDNSMKKLGTFIPFSEGTRNCIGKKFAMMEMKVLLAHVIRNFTIETDPEDKDVGLCWGIVLYPLKPLKMRFARRK